VSFFDYILVIEHLLNSSFRFYATDSEHASQNGNTRPGTVVDKGITAV
jgi:hypothetical protein